MTNSDSQFKWGDIVVPADGFKPNDKREGSNTFVCLGGVRSRPGLFHAVGVGRSTSKHVSPEKYKKVGNIIEDTDYEW